MHFLFNLRRSPARLYLLILIASIKSVIVKSATTNNHRQLENVNHGTNFNHRRECEKSLKTQVRGNHCEFVNTTTAEIKARRSANLMAGNRVDSSTGADERSSDCVFDVATRLSCDASTFFREPSGRCNNLNDKTWGMAGTPFRRIRASMYEDGFQAVRETGIGSGNVLPNPRVVSTAVTRTNEIVDNLGLSMQLMQWGQFIAHEVTAIREALIGAICCPDMLFAQENPGETPDRGDLNRARDRIQNSRGDICIAIERNNDPVYGKDVCMTQVRSTAVPLEDCSPSPRHQMNTATHFIDGSAVYGSSTSAHERLRSGRDGKLKSQFVGGAELPPRDLKVDCPDSPRCPFDAGDGRVNTTPNLATTHIIFLRKHNKIATGLKAVNPRWSDERLFQESRRIVIAIQQNIHYNEWLQLLLGSKLNDYNLRKSSTSNFRNLYNPNRHPGLLNELAAAAMRFGHTLVGGQFTVGTGEFDLTNHFDTPELVYTKGTAQCLAGLSINRPGKFDRLFTEPMRDSLFDSHLDIVTLNINRGRDHGLGSYVQYREHYGLAVPNSFNDMLTTHPADVVNVLRNVYDDVGDVELYIGGVTENKLSDGYIGPLFAEILGDGFRRLRDGDRFYFEGQRSGFTRDQLNSIRRYTYAKLICENGGLDNIPRDAFKRSSRTNPSVRCTSLTDVDLNLWAEDSRVTTVSSRSNPCYWSTVRLTECCEGTKTVTRECRGHSLCRPGGAVYGCEGSTITTHRCSCGYDFVCILGYYCQTSDFTTSITRATSSTTTTTTTTTPRPPACYWTTISTADCCSGRQLVTRRCSGHSSCRPGYNGCTGSIIQYQSCRCQWFSIYCQSGCRESVSTTTQRPITTRRAPLLNCSWSFVTYTQCYNGVQTKTRICGGDPYCYQGSPGCLGERIITVSCSSGYSIGNNNDVPQCYNGVCP